MTDELDRVALRLKTWRDEAGLSLQQLAGRSGVAASTIQKIERRQMVPTIAVLLKIAHGLGRRPGEFVEDEREDVSVVMQRSEDRQVWSDGSGGSVERLVADLSDPSFEVWRVVHLPGGQTGPQTIHFEGEQLLVCERGELTAEVGDERFVLRSGDTLHFKAQQPHGWRNESDEPVQFLIVGSLPPAMRGVFKRGSAVAPAKGPEGA